MILNQILTNFFLMKAIYFKATIFSLITILSISCSSDDSSDTTEIADGGTAQTQTWVKLTAMTSTGVVKSNYKILMFEQPVSSTTVLPAIKKEVTTDVNGLAYFDLNTMITSNTPTTYYFEAFVQSGENYVWKSVSHPNFQLKKGTMATSSIIVN